MNRLQQESANEVGESEQDGLRPKKVPMGAPVSPKKVSMDAY